MVSEAALRYALCAVGDGNTGFASNVTTTFIQYYKRYLDKEYRHENTVVSHKGSALVHFAAHLAVSSAPQRPPKRSGASKVVLLDD